MVSHVAVFVYSRLLLFLTLILALTLPISVAQLKALVHEAESRGLRFVYALSPGQDIVFSSASDLTLLKRKLRQVHEYMHTLTQSHVCI